LAREKPADEKHGLASGCVRKPIELRLDASQTVSGQTFELGSIVSPYGYAEADGQAGICGLCKVRECSRLKDKRGKG